MSRLKTGHEKVLLKMTGFQFGLISSSCTTEHKLQGCTALKLFVCDWAYHPNWLQVVLSPAMAMLDICF